MLHEAGNDNGEISNPYLLPLADPQQSSHGSWREPRAYGDRPPEDRVENVSEDKEQAV